jgi:AbrB family looped-hinge helix DNA binding protein
MKAVVSKRGQVTLPKALREKLELAPGTVMEFGAQNGSLIGRKVLVDPVARVRGCLGKAVDVDQYLNRIRGPIE